MPDAWEDFRDALSGQADSETRQRVLAALDDPESSISRFSQFCGVVAEPLFGALPKIVLVRPRDFYWKHAVFGITYLAAFVLLITAVPPRDWRETLGGMMCVGLLLGIGIRELLRVSKQLDYGGPEVRGTLVEAATGAFLGMAFFWLVAGFGLLEWLLRARDLRAYATWAIMFSIFPAHVCLTYGLGLRERWINSEKSIAERWSVGLRVFVMTLPWLVGAGWFCGAITQTVHDFFSLSGRSLPWVTMGGVTGAIVTGLLAVQSCTAPWGFQGSLRNALIGTALFLIAMALFAVPIVLMLLGLNVNVSLFNPLTGLIVLFFAYCGFQVGATERTDFSASAIRKMAIRVSGAIGAGCILGGGLAMAAGYLLANWVPLNRLVALVLGLVGFWQGMQRMDGYLFPKLYPQSPDAAAGPAAFGREFARGLLVGPKLVAWFLRESGEAIRGTRQWSLAS